jgi:FAD/FMN-containing dehydrogenase
MLKNNSGYDLKQLFIGSEGTLGIVTRVVLSLKESPQSALSALVALDDAAHIAALLKHMDRHMAGALSAFEVMWGGYFRAVTEPGGHAAPMSRAHLYYVVMEAQGADQKADEGRFTAALERAVESGWVADAILPKSQSERDRIWAIREDFTSILADQPQFLYDVSLPIKHMVPYVETVSNALRARWPEHRFHVLGHIGDGNLHFFVSPRGADPDLHHAVDAVVYGPLAQFGGVISAEHGIGLEKKRWLPLSRSAAEMATMRLLKRSLDPRNILNPGKIFDVDRID